MSYAVDSRPRYTYQLPAEFAHRFVYVIADHGDKPKSVITYEVGGRIVAATLYSSVPRYRCPS